MLRTTGFHRKTRRGRVLRIIREHYLRDDISPGVPDLEPPAPADVATLGEAPFERRYVVIDTNVALHQMDVLECECDAMRDFIVPQTVMAETRHRDLALFKRLQALVRDSSRRFYMFANEHHRDCFSDRRADETPNDYNDRCIRRVAQWYGALVKDRGLKVLLVTNDAANRDKALAEGLHAVSFWEFVGALRAKFPMLQEKAARPQAPKAAPGAARAAAAAKAGSVGRAATASGTASAGSGDQSIYRKYLPADQVGAMLRARQAFQVRAPSCYARRACAPDAERPAPPRVADPAAARAYCALAGTRGRRRP